MLLLCLIKADVLYNNNRDYSGRDGEGPGRRKGVKLKIMKASTEFSI